MAAGCGAGIHIEIEFYLSVGVELGPCEGGAALGFLEFSLQVSL